jgi:glutamate-1-semialdehyde 2,1-aminomutase
VYCCLSGPFFLQRRRDWAVGTVGSIGCTLAANALSLCAMRATLENVLTDEAFAKMLVLNRRLYEGCVNVIVKHQVFLWSVVRLGARVEYCFTSPAPRNGSQAYR